MGHFWGMLMATIERRGTKSWRVRIRRNGFPEKSKTFSELKEAESWLNSFETGCREYGENIPELSLLHLTDLIERYKVTITPLKKWPRKELSRLNTIQKHSIANLVILKADRFEIERYRDERLGTVSGKTVREELMLLQQVYHVAIVSWGLNLYGNPVQLVKKPSNNCV